MKTDYRNADYDHKSWHPSTLQSEKNKKIEISEILNYKITGHSTCHEHILLIRNLRCLIDANDIDNALKLTHAIAAHHLQGAPIPDRVYPRHGLKKKPIRSIFGWFDDVADALWMARWWW